MKLTLDLYSTVLKFIVLANHVIFSQRLSFNQKNKHMHICKYYNTVNKLLYYHKSTANHKGISLLKLNICQIIKTCTVQGCPGEDKIKS